MIEKTFVLSTAHITSSTNQVLTELKPVDLDDEQEFDQLPFRYVARHHYGFIIFISDSLKEADSIKQIFELFPDLHPIIDMAIQNECTIINIDRDAPVIGTLPRYEW